MADVLNDELPPFLRRCLARGFRWGELDCALMLADWLVTAHKLTDDPARAWRGRYRDAESCAALIGGEAWPILVGRAARRMGLPATRDPLTGDIAVLRIDGIAVAAIRSRDGWVMMSQDGLVWTRAPAKIIGAWRV